VNDPCPAPTALALRTADDEIPARLVPVSESGL